MILSLYSTRTDRIREGNTGAHEAAAETGYELDGAALRPGWSGDFDTVDNGSIPVNMDIESIFSIYVYSMMLRSEVRRQMERFGRTMGTIA